MRSGSLQHVVLALMTFSCIGFSIGGCSQGGSRSSSPAETTPFRSPGPANAARSPADRSAPARRVVWAFGDVGTLAVFPFKCVAEGGDGAADAVAGIVEEAFVNSARFKVTTRRHLKDLLSEQDMQLVLGSEDPAATLRGSSFTGAEALVVGTISAFRLSPGGEGVSGVMRAEVRILRVSDGHELAAYSTRMHEAADFRAGGREANPAMVTDKLARLVAQDLVSHLVPERGDPGRVAVSFERQGPDGLWSSCQAFTDADTQGRVVLRNLPAALGQQLFSVVLARSGRADDLMSRELSSGETREVVAYVEFSPATFARDAGRGLYIATLLEGARPMVVQPFRISRSN